MKDYSNIKEKLRDKLIAKLDERIESARIAMQSAEESKQSETKSTAGDKHETGRALMQLEQDMNEAQIQKAAQLKAELQSIDLVKVSDTAGPGSLIVCENGNYFISIGMGKIDLDGSAYFAISPGSPLGSLLAGKTKNDKVMIQNKESKILSIH